MNADAEPVHRSFCQIKVFRDKVIEYVVRGNYCPSAFKLKFQLTDTRWLQVLLLSVGCL